MTDSSEASFLGKIDTGRCSRASWSAPQKKLDRTGFLEAPKERGYFIIAILHVRPICGITEEEQGETAYFFSWRKDLDMR